MGEFLRNRLVVGLQNAAKDLNAIANLNVSPKTSAAENDAGDVVNLIKDHTKPTSVVDLALELKWNDPDRLARALTFASERGLLALSRIKDQTFVGLPTKVGSF